MINPRYAGDPHRGLLKNDGRTVLVQIATPYLALPPERFLDRNDPMDAIGQFLLCGYQPDNLADTQAIQTGRHHVLLRKTPLVDLQLPLLPDLVIKGMTERSEEDTRSLKGTGIIVARYSMFHGGPSTYTGSTPESAGYALDIPKDTSIVKRLLQCDDFLDAIVAREESRIRSSLDALNANHQPSEHILVTPYLTEALALPQAEADA